MKWQDQLSKIEITLIEDYCKTNISKLGYSFQNHSIAKGFNYRILKAYDSFFYNKVVLTKRGTGHLKKLVYNLFKMKTM